MRTIRRILLLLVSLAALPAAATFHLWAMTELYSNADGSVQFVELRALTSAQEFVAGHAITASSGGVTHRFTLPSNLEGDSSGRRMLIGTQGFAALNVVQPDFVVPNGFFFPGGGTVDWGEGSDVWSHPALPTNGDDSLNRDGSTGRNSPQNYVGQVGHVSTTPVASALNVQGLWWASPAGVESGWGLNLTQQGDTLFATWFTYDTDGSGLWLVMSEGRRQAGTNTYAGALYRTTGPAFSAATFNPAQVTVTQVGSATLTFTDASSGTFAYTVNGITQAKAITRQVYASPVPACAEGAAPGTPNFQDLWWRSPAGSESGWGVNITHQGDVLFVTWFTYDANGKGLWLVASEARLTAPNTYSGTLFRTTGPAFGAVPWNASQVTVTAVGTVTFTFSDANNGTFAYTVNGVSQAKPITRQVYASPTTVCR